MLGPLMARARSSGTAHLRRRESPRSGESLVPAKPEGRRQAVEHLSTICKAGEHLEAAIQSMSTSRGEIGYRFEQKCRNVCHLSNRMSRCSTILVLSLQLLLHNLSSLKHLTWRRTNRNCGISHALY
jgi:hypothetical protein